MPSRLHSTLESLAIEFTDGVLAVIRAASLDELLVQTGEHGVGNGRRTRGGSVSSGRRAPTAEGRLPRRSSEDIAAALDKVVGLVKKSKDGLRAEQIREELGLQSKELPRILKEGLSSKRLRAKGQKRATTYYAV